MEERLQHLHQVFEPRSVAFVGATDKIEKWGFIILNNILHGGWEGGLYPVNPNRDEVLGRKTWPSVSAIPDEVDLAVITVPAAGVRESLADCARKGVKAVVVITAGFKEMGGDAAEMEKEIVADARRAGMVLIGPNGQGIISPPKKLFAWMPHFHYPKPGPVAVISQSGNVQGLMIQELMKLGVGVSRGVSSGNEADLRMEDYFAYLAEDDETKVILAYMEGVTDGRRFLELAGAAARKKPVIILKGGRSAFGMSAARSHTGALAVSDDIFAAACRQAGIITVDTIHQAGVTAAAFVGRPLPKGRRVGILTWGGGLGVIASDICARNGLTVPPLSAAAIERMRGILPAWWVPGNPVDMVAGAKMTVVPQVVETMLESGNFDALLITFIGPEGPEEGTFKPLNPQTVQMREGWKKTEGFLGIFQKYLNGMMEKTGIPIMLLSSYGAVDQSPVARAVILRDLETPCQALGAMARYAGLKTGA